MLLIRKLFPFTEKNIRNSLVNSMLSPLFTQILNTTKLSNNPKYFDYENESIDSKEDICKTFSKHFFLFTVETLRPVCTKRGITKPGLNLDLKLIPNF